MKVLHVSFIANFTTKNLFKLLIDALIHIQIIFGHFWLNSIIFGFFDYNLKTLEIETMN